MARVISASVGRLGGVNRAADVVTVQELLNSVHAASGGAAPPLAVDGKCGPKTIAAIQAFQLKHFGWKGADGRVDPDGVTLARLNALATPTVVPPAPPPPSPPPPLPTSTRFVIHRMGDATSFAAHDVELFFHLTDMVNGHMGIYWFRPSGRPVTKVKPRSKFVGPSRSFSTRLPHAVDKLEGGAMYSSRQTSGVVTSRMVLFLSSGPVQTDMPHHLIGPGAVILPGPGDVATALAGDLVFIKMG